MFFLLTTHLHHGRSTSLCTHHLTFDRHFSLPTSHHNCFAVIAVLSLQRMLSSYLALVCLAWRLGMASVHAFQPVNAVSSTLLQSFETTTSYRSPSPTTASSRSNAIGMSSMTSVDYRATYNFGPASSRDTIVYSAERPGNDPDSKTTRVNNEQVMDWST